MGHEWRGKNLYDVFGMLLSENDEAMETQIRGWGALAEVYLEQYNQLGELITNVSEAWTSDGGDTYIEKLELVKEQLYESWSNAYDNAHALNTIASNIGALQSTLETLKEEFETKMDAKVNQYYADVEEANEWHDFGPFADDTPTEPKVETELNNPDMGRDGRSPNKIMNDLMESTMSTIMRVYVSDLWVPTEYSGPLNSQAPTGMGFGGPPGISGGPPGVNAGPPPTLAMTQPPNPNVPPPVTKGPPTVPVVKPTTTAPTQPNIPRVNPTTARPPVVGAPPTTGVGRPTGPNVRSPNVARPAASGRPLSPGAGRPGLSGPPTAAGKPPAGKMAPPPSAIGPKGAAKPVKPGKGRPGGPNAGVPGKPGAGKMAPPPIGASPKGKQPGKPSSRHRKPSAPGAGTPPGLTPPAGRARPTAPGKPGATKSGRPTSSAPGGPDDKGRFAPPPVIGGRPRGNKKPEGPDVPGEGGKGTPPVVGHPGRVVRPGSTRPVLTGRNPSQPMLNPRGLGVPPSLSRPAKAGRISPDAPGVIRPAREASTGNEIPRHVRDLDKLRQRMKDPLFKELVENNHRMAGLPMPVIDTPQEAEPERAGPVLGYKATKSR